MINQEEASKDLSVDILKLEDECKNQATNYKKWADKLAEAKMKLDEYKDNLKFKEAELDLAVRQDPSRFGVSKITENTVFNVVQSCSDIKILTEQTRYAKYDVDILVGIVEGLAQKKKMLELEVQLYIGQYFATPNTLKAEESALKRRSFNPSEDAAMRDSLESSMKKGV